MKPIWQTLLTLNTFVIVQSQKFQEQYPFPPHFPTIAPMLSSDSTIYLPPESSTPVPYYPVNSLNKYPIKFLPPTAVKAPSVYPTPFPISTLHSDFENEANKDIKKLKIPMNIAEKSANTTNTRQTERGELRPIHRVPMFQPKFEISNHFESDLKKAQDPVDIQAHGNHNPASRRMTVTSEIQRNDNNLVKSASYGNAQYLQPGVIIASTTEPAIPILRLSNEMDLDGSFSYEALGADQTHYVQHSRMENVGTDKEEQVVEGSYSYVGDNGQTYTVHYVADSNGYRASGDHLPVAPPIPEIIQRAVQYNLAEEARKPPHLKQTWENENKDYESDENNNRYTVTSLRNLFTGRTPEAFSFGFGQGTNTQSNFVAAASSNVPVKSSFDVINDQPRSKSNTPITPQITFLASQGAHNPSSQPQSQVTSRIVSTEKSQLPQLVNYEAVIKESDPDANKGLWRWQYGLATSDNLNANKNTISRSSGEGDDVIINFNDMTPDQYTRMIHSQIADHHSADPTDLFDYSKTNNKYSEANDANYRVSTVNTSDKTIIQNNVQNLKNHDIYGTTIVPTENSLFSTSLIYTSPKNSEYSDFYHSANIDGKGENIYSKIISSHNFIPKSNIVTHTYNLEDVTNDIQVDILKNIPTTEKSTTEKEKIINSETKYPDFSNTMMNNIFEGVISTHVPMINTTDYILKNVESVTKKNDFKPVSMYDNYYDTHSNPTTIETNIGSEAEMIKDNIFLKDLLRPKVSEFKAVKKVHNTSAKEFYDEYEPRDEKVAKILQYQTNPQNDIKFNQKKTFDINDVFDYVNLKNNFESSKTRPKNLASMNIIQNYNQKDVRPVRFLTNFDTAKNEDDKVKGDYNDTYQVKHNHQKELQGLIKNYKVLQRQKNVNHSNNFSEPAHRNVKTFHNLALPPLGRAGPSLKSYLPPAFA